MGSRFVVPFETQKGDGHGKVRAVRYLHRNDSDCMVDEYGMLESGFVFVNLWGHPLGQANQTEGSAVAQR